MSYDQFILPGGGRKTAAPSRPRLADVARLVEGVPGVERAAGPLDYVLDDAASGPVQVAIAVDEDDVREIQVTASHRDEPPKAMWSLCVTLASALGWKVYDPQGDAWYRPEQLASAARGSQLTGDGLLLLGGAGVAIVAGVVWILRGKPADASLWAMAAGVFLLAVGRVWQRLAGRE